MQKNSWNSLISRLPNPHFLQTYEWGQVKARYGWNPFYAAWDADGKFQIAEEPEQLSGLQAPVAAALVLKRQILRSGFASRLSILYIPRGPLLNWADMSLRERVLNDLQALARQAGAIFIKMDPDVVLGTGLPGGKDDSIHPDGKSVLAALKSRGWRDSSDQIQFKNTVWIDLRFSEEELLARMKQKTRYNIRLATKKGVTVRRGTPDDFPQLYNMYAETSVRDGFVIRDKGYYDTVWSTFTPDAAAPFTNDPSPFLEPLIARVDEEPVAGLFVFYFAGRAYYVYGMSRNAHREKMPTYLLQWEAIKRARALGCSVYDLWGAPDVFDERDPMWGVYRFKEGLGGSVVRTLGAWDFAPNRFWYQLYSEVIPRLLDLMRSRGRTRTRQSIGGT